MKIILGLGNPSEKYTKTRHNVGFAFVAFLQKEWGFSAFSVHKKFEAEISEGNLSGEKIILAKPTTFMNTSGIAARKILDFYHLTPEDLLVIQDELDLPFGTHKIALDSSSAGHNGIKSIIEHLGTQHFTRLRIGIATEPQSVACLRNAHNFVLDTFSQEETGALSTRFPTYAQLLQKLFFLK
jgi:PTH1 family peptidyl-tRNA hydrolase